jgi:hypothetical protein
MAWEHGGADFQSRYDKSTVQAQEMRKERCAFYDCPGTCVSPYSSVEAGLSKKIYPRRTGLTGGERGNSTG